MASREGSGTSRDCLWPAGSSSESYDSPGSLPDSAHAQAASDGSPKHREDRGGGPPSPHSSGRPSRDAGRERRQAKRLLTPTGIVAQLRCAKAFRYPVVLSWCAAKSAASLMTQLVYGPILWA